MGAPRLARWEAEDGPLTEKRMMGLMEREGFGVAIYAYREGTIFSEHAHGQDKCDAVLEGTLRITVGADVFDRAGGRPALFARRHAACGRSRRPPDGRLARRDQVVR